MSANNAAGGSSVGPGLFKRSAGGCHTLGLQLHALDASTEGDVDRAFVNLGPTADRRPCDRQPFIFGCIFCDYETNFSIDYETKLDYKVRQPRSSRGVSGDDPEGGARRGVLRRRLVTACPGRPGTPPSRHYDLGARSSLHGSGRQMPAVVGRRAPKETEARPREPKTATVERREASVLRRGKLALYGALHSSTGLT